MTDQERLEAIDRAVKARTVAAFHRLALYGPGMVLLAGLVTHLMESEGEPPSAPSLLAFAIFSYAINHAPNSRGLAGRGVVRAHSPKKWQPKNRAQMGRDGVV